MTAQKPEKAPAQSSRSEFSRRFALVRAEVSSLVADADRKAPLYSKSQEEARAKLEAVLKSLESFIDMVAGAKRS